MNSNCLQVVRLYNFMKKIIRASCIAFLFVKTENNFMKGSKTFSPRHHSLVKTSAKLMKVFDQQMKTLDCVSGF